MLQYYYYYLHVQLVKVHCIVDKNKMTVTALCLHLVGKKIYCNICLAVMKGCEFAHFLSKYIKGKYSETAPFIASGQLLS